MKTYVHKLVVPLAVLGVEVVIGATGSAAAEPLVMVVPAGWEIKEGERSTFYPMPASFLDGARLQDIISASQFAALPG